MAVPACFGYCCRYLRTARPTNTSKPNHAKNPLLILAPNVRRDLAINRSVVARAHRYFLLPEMLTTSLTPPKHLHRSRLWLLWESKYANEKCQAPLTRSSYPWRGHAVFRHDVEPGSQIKEHRDW